MIEVEVAMCAADLKTRPKMLRRLLPAIAFVFALVGPSVSPTWASGGHGGEAAPAAADALEVSAESADGTRAVKLGEFSIRVYHTVSSRKDTVTFILHAIVAKDKFAEFEHAYVHRKHKTRDQIVVATRLVSIEEYDDPELKKFRRRILLRLRRALPELPIEDIRLSDFTLSSEST
jgi:hypothetical protein